MQLSEEQWQGLQSLPFHRFQALCVPLGTQFLRQTPAKKIGVWTSTGKEVRSAFAKLALRQHPIEVVDIAATEAIVWETTVDAEIFTGTCRSYTFVSTSRPNNTDYVGTRMAKSSKVQEFAFFEV